MQKLFLISMLSLSFLISAQSPEPEVQAQEAATNMIENYRALNQSQVDALTDLAAHGDIDAMVHLIIICLVKNHSEGIMFWTKAFKLCLELERASGQDVEEVELASRVMINVVAMDLCKNDGSLLVGIQEIIDNETAMGALTQKVISFVQALENERTPDEHTQNRKAVLTEAIKASKT